jgi:acyl-CoA synthetase (AMP-forming)/AMP-acid ligase II
VTNRSIAEPDIHDENHGSGGLLDRLSDFATRTPHKLALGAVITHSGGLDCEPFSYAALWARSSGAARALFERGVRQGDRVCLSVGEPKHFVPWFIGTLMLGAIAVPVPGRSPWLTPRSLGERLQAILNDARPRLFVSDSPAEMAAFLGGASTPIVEAHMPEPRRCFDGPLPTGAQPAFLQYTSGSTGDPKGVIVTHGNLAANCRAMASAAGFQASDAMFSWLPLYHDMGLVGGVLLFLHHGLSTYVAPTSSFVARPDTWLYGISKFRATVSVAPPFAYDLCAERVRVERLDGVDLSCWRLAFVGAEPIAISVLNAFAGRFGPLGFREQALYPVYGLAEATLGVTFPVPGAPLTIRSLRSGRSGLYVGNGAALPGHEVTIRDCESGALQAEGAVGEVCVSGPSISTGYFNRRPRDPAIPLRTGDLGCLLDGQLFIVDRIKDLIIVAGQNYAPSDLERSLARLDGLRRGRIAAFSLPSVPTEALHVVAEIRRGFTGSLAALRAEVAHTLLNEFGLRLASCTLVSSGTLELTTSGKLRRHSVRERFERGDWAASPSSPQLIRDSSVSQQR